MSHFFVCEFYKAAQGIIIKTAATNTGFVQVLPLTFVLKIELSARQNLTQSPITLSHGTKVVIILILTRKNFYFFIVY